MWRYLEGVLLACFALVLIGCNRSQEEAVRPTPTSTPHVVLAQISGQAARQNSPLATPTPQLVAFSPILLPTITPTPIPTATNTAYPYMRYNEDGTNIVVTPIRATPLVTCTSAGAIISCYDELLDMYFSYPLFMGRILDTTLRQGGYAGYGYEYEFEDQDSHAGGRSSDYSEGREPMFTDAKGFDGRSAEDICAGWVAAICQEHGSSAALAVILPKSEWLCSEAMMFTTVPLAILELDLPHHPLIHGFAFSFQLMPSKAAKAFHEKWYENGRSCKAETKVELGTAMEQLQQDLLAGTADAEIQHRYDAMIQLAKSIQSSYIAMEPQ